MCPVAIFDFN